MADQIWVGHVTTAAGIVTGWHTHADYDTYIYVLQGDINNRWDRPPAATTASAKRRSLTGEGFDVV